MVSDDPSNARAGWRARAYAIRHSTRTRRARAFAVATPVVALSLALSACTAGGTPGAQRTVTKTSSPSGTTSAPRPTQSSTPPARPATFTARPAARSNVNPISPVALAVKDGTLRSVRMLNAQGKKVSGTMSSDATSWHTTEVLGYGKTYRLSAEAVDSSGESVRTYHRAFTTLTPGNMTMPYFQRIGGYALDNGASYGVAMVPIVHFDEPIPNQAAAERALEVTTSPHVNGSWYWSDDQNVHWRPQHYYAPGTKVTIHANVYGKQVGPGLYGQSDASTSFRIGPKHLTVAYDNAPKAVNKVKVYNGSKLVRTMNTSMGKHSGEKVNGQYINFYTLEGNYTVIAHENPAIMSSQSYGLPTTAPGGYPKEKIYWSTKISVDGIYLHELDTTIYDQDHGLDVSHGCLNMNHANARWYYKFSRIGDPVQVKHTGGPTIAVWEGGDWSVPWSKWQAGSALH